jgi:hypothetical protein
MSKSKEVCGCLFVVVLGIVGCGGSAQCPSGYARVGDLCMVSASQDAAMGSGDGSAVDVGPSSDGSAPGADGGWNEGDGGRADAGPTCVPGAEACNQLDDDCDGRIDEELAVVSFYEDADGDGHGDVAAAGTGCEVPFGAVALGDDCDDTCPTCFPGSTETCNGIDDDCEGGVDEGVMTTFFLDADGDGHGVDGTGLASCAPTAGHTATIAGDCDDACVSCHFGGTEVCDGRDQDCRNGVDDGVLVVFYRDADGDRFGNAAITVSACSAPVGFVDNAGDCVDTNAAVHPDATEVCNHADDNCTGGADEGLPVSTYYLDVDLDGFAPNTGGSVSDCMQPMGFTSRMPISSNRETVDCFPMEARAFPGQTMYFTAPIVGADIWVAWDYDCSGTNQTRYLGGGSCSGAVPCAGTTGAFVSAASGTRPTCGESGTFQLWCAFDATLACRSTTETRVQSCR